MTLDIVLYGPLADLIGREVCLNVTEPLGDIAALRAHLARTYPAASDLLLGARTRCILDDRIVPDDTPVEGSAVIEFFPPVSGG